MAGAARMAAWRVHAYGAAPALESTRVPALRAPDHVLVRVRAAAVNPLDAAMLGGYGARVLNALRALAGDDGVEFPLVPGRDFLGEVVRAGAAARLRPGQAVWGVVPPHRAGALAQYVVVRDGWAGPAPARLGVAAGGALFAALSAAAALRAAGLRGRRGRGGARPRVLLLGLGGVGRAALQLLVYEGAEVVVGCSGEQCPRALELGAAAALDRRHVDYDRALEDAGPFEAIVDCAGAGGDEAGARRWRFARYVTLSSPLLRDTDERGLLAGAACSAARLALQAARAAAPAAACPPPHVRWAYFTPDADDIELLRRLAERGEFTVYVERMFPWQQADAALALAARPGARGKLLVDVDHDHDHGAADHPASSSHVGSQQRHPSYSPVFPVLP